MPKWTPAPDGALRCGAARECVTPPEALLPRLYGLMNQRFGGVRDALFVRAPERGDQVALRRVAGQAVDDDLRRQHFKASFQKRDILIQFQCPDAARGVFRRHRRPAQDVQQVELHAFCAAPAHIAGRSLHVCRRLARQTDNSLHIIL